MSKEKVAILNPSLFSLRVLFLDFLTTENSWVFFRKPQGWSRRAAVKRRAAAKRRVAARKVAARRA